MTNNKTTAAVTNRINPYYLRGDIALPKTQAGENRHSKVISRLRGYAVELSKTQFPGAYGSVVGSQFVLLS